MPSRKDGDERVLIAHAPILRIIRNRWIKPAIRRIEKVYGKEAKGYAFLSPDEKLRVFKKIALGSCCAGDSASVRFWTSPSDVIEYTDASGLWDSDSELLLLDEDDLLYEADYAPREDDSYYVVHDPYEGQNLGIYHLDPVFATALVAAELTKLIPTLLPWEACRFALTGEYPDTREMLLLPVYQRPVSVTGNAGKLPEPNGLRLFVERARLGDDVLHAIKEIDREGVRISVIPRYYGGWRTSYEIQALGALRWADFDAMVFDLHMKSPSAKACYWQSSASVEAKSVSEGVVDWCTPDPKSVKPEKPTTLADMRQSRIEEMLQDKRYLKKNGNPRWNEITRVLQLEGLVGHNQTWRDIKKTYKAKRKKNLIREALSRKSFVLVLDDELPEDQSKRKELFSHGVYMQIPDPKDGEILGWVKVRGLQFDKLKAIPTDKLRPAP